MGRYKIFAFIAAFFLCACNSNNADKTIDKDSNTGPETYDHTNYGYNIVVASDLSNRILNERKYDDPQILEMITAKLKRIFQKSADLNINGKFLFTTINND